VHKTPKNCPNLYMWIVPTYRTKNGNALCNLANISFLPALSLRATKKQCLGSLHHKSWPPVFIGNLQIIVQIKVQTCPYFDRIRAISSGCDQFRPDSTNLTGFDQFRPDSTNFTMNLQHIASFITNFQYG
jgi:hypothetical protein